MKIRRVILRGVRNFKDLDRSFEDSWSQTVPDSLLLIGPNGSGKSTLLEAIAALWQQWFYLLGQSEDKDSLTPLLAGAEFAAIEIIDLERDPIWIAVDRDRDGTALDFLAMYPGSHRFRIASTGTGRSAASRKPPRYKYAGPGQGMLTEIAEDTPMPPWLLDFSDQLTKNTLGILYDLPNLVHLESETRLLPPLKGRFRVIKEPEEYHWLARYEPTVSRKGSLQNYLYNLSAVDQSTFADIVAQVNEFLVGKRLRGFDRRTGDLMVAVSDGGEHPIEALSSGEKQVLLMLATITRWLRPGGIVLIDEPDLHLHVSLTTDLVSHLRRMVPAKGGQLILASHAPELWKNFTESHLVRLGNLGEQESTT